jgi:hypothetical protein
MSLGGPNFRLAARRRRSARQGKSFCPASRTGGHGTSPQEQNTQQSPALGFNSAPQPLHRKKNWHASVGIVSVDRRPQCGQVMVEASGISAREQLYQSGAETVSYGPAPNMTRNIRQVPIIRPAKAITCSIMGVRST